jgi:hypothetical protein
MIASYRNRTNNQSTFLGMWHSHPSSAALPSPPPTRSPCRRS